ncbi:tyrosine-type recombinase/integrase [Bythopirellula polymerisocia]|uniref:Site-specific tyrosine recombinase XerC n=1 Tax=Bythopirellula polymerisocia TaxID=2528003 RepID=A0A5C6CYD5_9BACT|nr:site-specific integrase [Bythopirellula polymerisocia]TWU29632.1 site-specific tyrosine recombinase XerC [Bythopirellula polymerisocia]
MPWSNNHLPKYRKHRSSGQAVVTLNGRDHYLGPHGTKASKREYDRLIGEWLQNHRNPLFSPSDGITIVELCARYWQHAKGYYVKDGRCTGENPSIRIALRFLREWYGKTQAADFGPLALKTLRQRMIDENQSRNYVNSQIGRIKRMFKWAVAEELIPPAVSQGLAALPGLRQGRSGARESDPVKPVEHDIVETTLPFLTTIVSDMVRIQRITGMRPAEVCLIRPCDIDRTGDVWLYRPSSHKTEHHGLQRIVFLGPQAQELMLRYLARGSEEYCFRPIDSEKKRLAKLHEIRVTPLSCGNSPGSNRKKKPKKTPGDRYITNSYRRAIHYACDKAFPHPELGSIVRKDMPSSQIAELKKWQSDHRWSPNQLRHAAATEIRREFGLEAAQIILGHRAADVTQVYAERDLAKGWEVARKR